MVKQTRPKIPLREDTEIKDFLDMITLGIVKFQTDRFIYGNSYRCV
ncbi:MAG: AAA-like domain protein [Oscillospiraceae bacterium]|nr:AAA-like domain protein [Oscillospiraceae bacterium]